MNRHITIFFVCLALLFALASCNSKVSGEVFLDTNGNGVRDADDRPAVNAKIMITSNGETIAEGLVDGEGKYAAKAKSLEGEVCVQVEPGSIDPNRKADVPAEPEETSTTKPPEGENAPAAEVPIAQKIKSAKAAEETEAADVKAATAKGEDSSSSALDRDDDGIEDDKDNCETKANKDQEDTDDDGMGDACDEDDDNDGKNDGFDNCPETANKDQADKDEDDIGDACDDDESASDKEKEDEKETVTMTTKGVCKKVKGRVKSVEIKVPVKLSYKPETAERLEVTCYAGADCNCKVTFPSVVGCTMEPMTMPEGLSYCNTAAASATADPKSSLLPKGSKAKVKSDSETTSEEETSSTEDPATEETTETTTAMPVASISEINVVTMNLSVDENIPVGEKKVYLKPEINCPDGKHKLAPLPVILKRENKLEISHSFSKLKAENQFKIVAEAKNNGASDVKDTTIYVKLSPEMIVKKVDSNCKDQVTAMECPGVDIAAGDSVQREVTVEIKTLGQAHKVQTTLTQTELNVNLQAKDIDWISEAPAEEDGPKIFIPKIPTLPLPPSDDESD